MDIYSTIAAFTGWPFLVAVMVLVGGPYIQSLRTKVARLEKAQAGPPSASTPRAICYSSRVRLVHLKTRLALHSHSRNYQHTGTSGQQQVTAFGGSNDDDFWIVKPPHHYPDAHLQGEAVRHGDIVRLEHLSTTKHLHSHSGYPSPVSAQQEVTAFSHVGDVNDDWRVEVEDRGVWTERAKVRLVHLQTGRVLHSHAGHALPDWGYGQQEITCFDGRNDDDLWQAVVINPALR